MSSQSCPFSGKSCDKPKVVSVTEIIDGHQNSYQLCIDCVGLLKNDHGNQVLDNMFKLVSLPIFDIIPQSYHSSLENNVVKDAVCVCGMTLYQLAKVGRLGCPECYKTFSSFILPVIEHNCKSLQHKGKVPRKFKSEKVLKLLEEQMQQAITVENYEKAAEIRDRIKEIVGSIKKQ